MWFRATPSPGCWRTTSAASWWNPTRGIRGADRKVNYRALPELARLILDDSVLGQVDLDQLLSERDQNNERLQVIIDEQTHPWGVKVSVVEVKDVELPVNMQRAIARQRRSTS